MVGLAAAASAQAATGGSYPSLAPQVTGISCKTRCIDADVAQAGSVVRIRGRSLDGASRVVFVGSRASGDETRARARHVTSRRLDVRVPRGTRTGPVVVFNRDGAHSDRSRATIAISRGDRHPAGSAPVSVDVSARKVFFGSRRPARLTYVVRGSRATRVRVELVRMRDDAVAASWNQGVVEPGVTRSVRWSGLAKGKVGSEGRYEFRIYTGREAEARAAASPGTADPADTGTFVFRRHEFPIRGAHEYGDAAARFGAARSGHSHQGQDVFAACGTPLVAARGGVVKWKAYHSAAGYYLVIDGRNTGIDYVYMHLREAALVEQGDKVYTGQAIGYVGDTGDAQGCHLHFEMWDAPGWYDGGSPFDPLKYLQAWDRFS